jgi:hypothetical protein
MVSFRPTMTGLISRALPEAVILTRCLTHPHGLKAGTRPRGLGHAQWDTPAHDGEGNRRALPQVYPDANGACPGHDDREWYKSVAAALLVCRGGAASV